jgi:hypothetical protein
VKTGYGKKHRAGNSGSKEKKIWRTLWLWDRAKPGQTSTLQETRKKTKKNQAVAVAKISGIQSKNTMRTESQEQPDQERDEFFIGLSNIIVNP